MPQMPSFVTGSEMLPRTLSIQMGAEGVLPSDLDKEFCEGYLLLDQLHTWEGV